jgi:hypothetical protein
MLASLRMPRLQSSGSTLFQTSGVCYNFDGLCNSNNVDLVFVSMGPISSAVAMYATERLLTRVLKGQLFRKGVLRKMRRLTKMIFEWNNICEVICEALDDVI